MKLKNRTVIYTDFDGHDIIDTKNCPFRYTRISADFSWNAISLDGLFYISYINHDKILGYYNATDHTHIETESAKFILAGSPYSGALPIPAFIV